LSFRLNIPLKATRKKEEEETCLSMGGMRTTKCVRAEREKWCKERNGTEQSNPQKCFGRQEWREGVGVEKGGETPKGECIRAGHQQSIGRAINWLIDGIDTHARARSSVAEDGEEDAVVGEPLEVHVCGHGAAA
jgi:hypothetical protein